MSHTLIKQPNGNFAIFSSCVDDFIFTNATKDDIVQMYIEDERCRIVERVDRMFEFFETGDSPPRHVRRPSMNWNDALERRVVVHGDNAEDISDCI